MRLSNVAYTPDYRIPAASTTFRLHLEPISCNAVSRQSNHFVEVMLYIEKVLILLLQSIIYRRKKALLLDFRFWVTQSIVKFQAKWRRRRVDFLGRRSSRRN